MKPITLIAGFTLLLMPHAALPQPTRASMATDAAALADCFTLKSTGEDRIAFMGWMVASLALVPRLKGVAQVDLARKKQLDEQVAAIITRLMTIDCAAQSKVLIKNKEGDQGFRIAGQSLGRMAVQELTSDPEAARAMSGYAEYIREEDFLSLAK